MLLAIECSGEGGSVALVDRDGACRMRALDAPRRHNATLLAAIDGLLREAGASPKALDAVAYGAGPGSFTGVRLAAAASYGLAWAREVPVFAIAAPLAAAWRAWHVAGNRTPVVWAIDARVEQVYWAHVHWRERGGPDVVQLRASGWAALGGELPAAWIGVGDGWRDARVPAEVRDRAVGLMPDLQPTATEVGLLARRRFDAGERPRAGDEAPIYLRGADAWDVPRRAASDAGRA